MTFAELRAMDTVNAYESWLSVANMKKAKALPEEYWKFFPDLCECGSENMMKFSLKAVTCCNPKCKIKMGFAIAELLSRFGVKGLKAASCSKVYEAMVHHDAELKKAGKPGILIGDSYVAVLAVPWEKYPFSLASTSKGTEFYQACQRIRNDTITFPKLVANLAIPGVGRNAEKLVGGFNSFEELLAAIKKYPSVTSFCVSRGVSAANTIFSFKNALFDIAVANQIFIGALRTEGAVKMNVCMTGMISLRGSKTTKDAFIRKCNDLMFDEDLGIQIIEIGMNSAKESNPFILYSRTSTDAKFRAGTARGEITDVFGKHPVLFKTDDFYELMERVKREWKIKTQEIGVAETWKIFPSILKSSMEKVLGVPEPGQDCRGQDCQGQDCQEMKAF